MSFFARLCWSEIKLFLREPFALIFAIALPLLVLIVMGSLFGATTYQGAPTATTYYATGSLAAVLAAVGLVSVPVELAGYRERGVLRRFRASGVPIAAIFGAQAAVGLVATALGATTLVVAGILAGGLRTPEIPLGVLAALVFGLAACVGLGLVLGAFLPNARAAQGVGLLLFFASYFVSGAGPPREFMPQAMRAVGDLLPVTHVVTALQDPWFGAGLNLPELGLLALLGALGVVVAAANFRWE